METGAVVNLTAIKGMDTRKIPSAKLLAIAADQSRLKAGEKLLPEAMPDITSNLVCIFSLRILKE